MLSCECVLNIAIYWFDIICILVVFHIYILQFDFHFQGYEAWERLNRKSREDEGECVARSWLWFVWIYFSTHSDYFLILKTLVLGTCLDRNQNHQRRRHFDFYRSYHRSHKQLLDCKVFINDCILELFKLECIKIYNELLQLLLTWYKSIPVNCSVNVFV